MMPNLGQLAYETYAEARDWKTYNGSPMPSWEEQDEGLRSAWIQAAETVAHAAEYPEWKYTR